MKERCLKRFHPKTAKKKKENVDNYLAFKLVCKIIHAGRKYKSNLELSASVITFLIPSLILQVLWHSSYWQFYNMFHMSVPNNGSVTFAKM